MTQIGQTGVGTDRPGDGLELTEALPSRPASHPRRHRSATQSAARPPPAPPPSAVCRGRASGELRTLGPRRPGRARFGHRRRGHGRPCGGHPTSQHTLAGGRHGSTRRAPLDRGEFRPSPARGAPSSGRHRAVGARDQGDRFSEHGPIRRRSSALTVGSGPSSPDCVRTPRSRRAPHRGDLDRHGLFAVEFEDVMAQDRAIVHEQAGPPERPAHPPGRRRALRAVDDDLGS